VRPNDGKVLDRRMGETDTCRSRVQPMREQAENALSSV
jgi:hypothetical protein